jgi:glycerophosphoryl diester phosphodiesterase
LAVVITACGTGCGSSGPPPAKTQAVISSTPRAPQHVNPRGVLISAHRGGAGQWPQDSLLAFRNALAANYDEIEGDAWLTREGQTFIYHDNTISSLRCPGAFAGRQIWKLTAAEVRTIRCQGQPIPTVQELLDLIAKSANHRTVLRLETKSYPGQTPTSAGAWARRVGSEVVAAGLADRAIMQDFNWNGLAGYHAASPKLRVSALITRPSPVAIAKATRLGAYDLSYAAAYSTPSTNADIAMHGLVPTVWGIDPVPPRPGPPPRAVAARAAATFAKVACGGARVVITNYPRILATARRSLACDR